MVNSIFSNIKMFAPILLGPFAFMKVRSKPGLAISVVALILGGVSLILYLNHGSKYMVTELSHSAAAFYAASVITYGLALYVKIEDGKKETTP